MQQFVFAVIAAITIATTPTAAQEPGPMLIGKAQVQVGTFLKIKVSGIPEGTKTLVVIDPIPPEDCFDVRDGGQSIYITSPKPITYAITVAVSGATPTDAPLGTSRRYEFIGKLEPDGPNPNPVTPNPVTPTGIPDDKFDNIGKAVFAAATAVPVAERQATAALYADVATKLENGDYPSAYAAQKDLQARRNWTAPHWASTFQAVATAWNKYYDSMDTNDVIAFQRAVAAGLK